MKRAHKLTGILALLALCACASNQGTTTTGTAGGASATPGTPTGTTTPATGPATTDTTPGTTTPPSTSGNQHGRERPDRLLQRPLHGLPHRTAPGADASRLLPLCSELSGWTSSTLSDRPAPSPVILRASRASGKDLGGGKLPPSQILQVARAPIRMTMAGQRRLTK